MHGRGLGESAADVAIIEFERVDSVKMDDGMVLPIGSDVYRAAWTGGRRRCFACQDVRQTPESIQRLEAYQCQTMTASYYSSPVIAKGIRQARLAVSLVHRNCLARAAGSSWIVSYHASSAAAGLICLF